MNPLVKLQNFGQSIWYDNIQRRLLENGQLAALITNGDIRGVTSNPVTAAPRDAASSAMSPVPHARSSTRDVGPTRARVTSRRFQWRSRPNDRSTVIKS